MVLGGVLSRVDMAGLGRAVCTCRRLRALVEGNPAFWRDLLVQELGEESSTLLRAELGSAPSLPLQLKLLPGGRGGVGDGGLTAGQWRRRAQRWNAMSGVRCRSLQAFVDPGPGSPRASPPGSPARDALSQELEREHRAHLAGRTFHPRFLHRATSVDGGRRVLIFGGQQRVRVGNLEGDMYYDDLWALDLEGEGGRPPPPFPPPPAPAPAAMAMAMAMSTVRAEAEGRAEEVATMAGADARDGAGAAEAEAGAGARGGAGQREPDSGAGQAERPRSQPRARFKALDARGLDTGRLLRLLRPGGVEDMLGRATLNGAPRQGFRAGEDEGLTPRPRASGSLTAVEPADGGPGGAIALLFGGLLPGDDFTNDSWILEGISTSAPPCPGSLREFEAGAPRWFRPWFDPDGSIPSPRWGHTATAFGSHVVVFGGSAPGKCFNDVWVLDLAPILALGMGGAGCPGPRPASVAEGASVRLADEDLALAVAGPGCRLAWRLAKVQAGCPSPPPRGGHAATRVGSRLYVLGGNTDKESYNDVWWLDLRDAVAGRPVQWSCVDALGTPFAPRVGHTACAIGKVIFILGGRNPFYRHHLFSEQFYGGMHALDTERGLWIKVGRGWKGLKVNHIRRSLLWSSMAQLAEEVAARSTSAAQSMRGASAMAAREVTAAVSAMERMAGAARIRAGEMAESGASTLRDIEHAAVTAVERMAGAARQRAGEIVEQGRRSLDRSRPAEFSSSASASLSASASTSASASAPVASPEAGRTEGLSVPVASEAQLHTEVAEAYLLENLRREAERLADETLRLPDADEEEQASGQGRGRMYAGGAAVAAMLVAISQINSQLSAFPRGEGSAGLEGALDVGDIQQRMALIASMGAQMGESAVHAATQLQEIVTEQLVPAFRARMTRIAGDMAAPAVAAAAAMLPVLNQDRRQRLLQSMGFLWTVVGSVAQQIAQAAAEDGGDYLSEDEADEMQEVVDQANAYDALLASESFEGGLRLGGGPDALQHAREGSPLPRNPRTPSPLPHAHTEAVVGVVASPDFRDDNDSDDDDDNDDDANGGRLNALGSLGRAVDSDDVASELALDLAEFDLDSDRSGADDDEGFARGGDGGGGPLAGVRFPRIPGMPSPSSFGQLSAASTAGRRGLGPLPPEGRRARKEVADFRRTGHVAVVHEGGLLVIGGLGEGPLRDGRGKATIFHQDVRLIELFATDPHHLSPL